MEEIEYVYTSKEYIKSFNKTLDTVARERKYLAKVEGPSMESSEGFAGFLVKNNFPQYFAVLNEEVIGWCDAVPVSFEGMNHIAVLGMGILQEFRNRGLGSKLLELTISHAKEKNNIEKIELEVFKGNTGGVEFYKKHNFRIEGERIKSRKLNGVYDNIILMGKFL